MGMSKDGKVGSHQDSFLLMKKSLGKSESDITFLHLTWIYPPETLLTLVPLSQQQQQPMGIKLLRRYYERTGDFNQIVLEIVTCLFDFGNNQFQESYHFSVRKDICDH